MAELITYVCCVILCNIIGITIAIGIGKLIINYSVKKENRKEK